MAARNIDFLKVVRMVFWSIVVGPGTNTQSARSRWSHGKIKGREQSMTTRTLRYLNTTGKNASNKVGNKTVPACRVHIWVAKKDRFSRSTYPWQHLDTVTLFTFPQFLRESRSCSLGLILHISVLRWTDVFKTFLWERFREISFEILGFNNKTDHKKTLFAFNKTDICFWLCPYKGNFAHKLFFEFSVALCKILGFNNKTNHKENAFCVQQNRHLFLTLSVERELCP